MKSMQLLKCSSLLVIFFSKSSSFWDICQVLLCLLPLTLSGASRCQLSIVRCCDSPQQKVLPYRWGTWSHAIHRIVWEDWRVSGNKLEIFRKQIGEFYYPKNQHRQFSSNASPEMRKPASSASTLAEHSVILQEHVDCQHQNLHFWAKFNQISKQITL